MSRELGTVRFMVFSVGLPVGVTKWLVKPVTSAGMVKVGFWLAVSFADE